MLLGKKEFLRRYLEATSVNALIEELGVHPATFHKWRKKYNIPALRNNGSRHWSAKLQSSDVRLIFQLKGELYAKDVGKKFGIDTATVYDIWEFRSRFKETLLHS